MNQETYQSRNKGKDNRYVQSKDIKDRFLRQISFHQLKYSEKDKIQFKEKIDLVE